MLLPKNCDPSIFQTVIWQDLARHYKKLQKCGGLVRALLNLYPKKHCVLPVESHSERETTQQSSTCSHKVSAVAKKMFSSSFIVPQIG